MRQIKKMFSLLISGVIILSCNSITSKKLEFFYYPLRNVYYDVTNSLYFYSLDGGKTWDSLNTKTKSEPSTLGAKQIIYSTSPDIWKDNATQIKQYNGHVIDITGYDSSVSQSDLAAERKIKKVKPFTEPEKKSEKKPGFFKRLFGKKN